MSPNNHVDPNACALCSKVKAAINKENSGTIVTVKSLVNIHGFKKDEAKAGLHAFVNCDNYPNGCPEMS
jgi:hypothetical protein